MRLKKLNKKFNELKASPFFEGLDVEELVEYNSVYESIAKQADLKSADLIIMGSQGISATDDMFIEQLVADHGVVAIPMYDFYPEDAKQRDPRAGLNQLRLSFCFSESTGAARRRDMEEAVRAFGIAVLQMSDLPWVSDMP